MRISIIFNKLSPFFYHLHVSSKKIKLWKQNFEYSFIVLHRRCKKKKLFAGRFYERYAFIDSEIQISIAKFHGEILTRTI